MAINHPPQALRLGIIGIGVGGSEILPAMGTVPEIELVACADSNRQVLERFHERYPSTRIYDTADELVADANVDAVWVSTPNRFHVAAFAPGAQPRQARRGGEAHCHYAG